ncbi:MAG: S-layer homology domain-containing protein, partial [Armatimonadetes bacterium]|nr:S-layer homology domain-containing protein [Armatimonadota bacterium]
ISTTASIEGPISICMTYNDADVPTGTAEADLALLHYVEDGGYWEDITVSVDTEANVVCGETDSLSVFTLSGLRPEFFLDVPVTGFGVGGVEPHWALTAIEACVDADIAAGYPDGLYRPDRPVTRDQMAVYIARGVAGGDASVPTGPAEATFPDVPLEHWAFKYVEYAAGQDIVQGYADGSYQPAWEVSRGHMAVFVARAKGWVSVDDDMTTAPELFPDVPAGYWCGTAVGACVDNGVVQGYDDGLYRPGTTVTRAQMAVYMARAFDLLD